MCFCHYELISNWTKLITQKLGLKSLTGKELVNNQYVINSVLVLITIKKVEVRDKIFSDSLEIRNPS
jgi:hypothetical protein